MPTSSRKKKLQPSVTPKEAANYDYLYRIGTNILSISVGLLFAQAPTQILPILSKLSNSSTFIAPLVPPIPPLIPAQTPFPITSQSLQLVATACCIFLTMLFALVGVLVTVAYAHGELKIPFRPAYLLVNVLLIALPLYFSVQAIGGAVTPIATDGQFNLPLFRAGAAGLLIFFLAQLGYLTYIYLFDIPIKNNKKIITPQNYTVIAIFLVLGIAFAVILFFSINTNNVLPCLVVSVGALIGSIIYLIFTPILRTPISELIDA